MEIDYQQTKTRTTLEKREHWRKKQQLKDLRAEHDKESKQKKFLKLEVRFIVDRCCIVCTHRCRCLLIYH
jgi:hypothetical protein